MSKAPEVVNPQESEFGSTKWHNLSVEECLALQTTKEDGLSAQEAASRLVKFGTNELTPPPKPGFLMKLWYQINNILIYILVAATILSAILQEWKEVALICAVVIINVTIGIVQEGKAEKAADAIKNMLAPKAMVIRGGAQVEIGAAEIVPGDIVKIKKGDQVPADVRMIEVSRLQTDEAMLTGESMPVAKHTEPVAVEAGLGDRKNLAFSATKVTEGEGTGIVIGTGDFAEIGRISGMVSKEEDTKTNLMVQLEIFGRFVSVFVAVIAVATLLIAHLEADEDLGTAFKSAVSIAVAIIPEGLPAVVTISLALAMQLMASNNAIIRKLPAIETLGSLSTICSDKTGTLTKNEMTVQKFRTAKGAYNISGVGYQPEGETQDANGSALPGDAVQRLWAMFEGCVLNNGAGLAQDHKTGQWKALGYPTEASLLTMGMKMGLGNLDGIQRSQKAKPKVNGVPFASEHKFMCQIHADGPGTDGKGAGAKLTCHVKGAADRLIKLCKDQVSNDTLGKNTPIDGAFWQEEARKLAALGLRTLAICRAEWPESRRNEDMDADTILKAQPFLTMVGIVAILDPPRVEVVPAIKVAHEAGIVVKMITGDHPETAIAIGKMLGIVDPNSAEAKAFTGPELDKMDDKQIEGICEDCNIFARASPENKISIVKALKARGQITSMTGDGVNDAPALKAANIGVAMGITGTDVSKEAAKMVLADDNFATIIEAVREGRRVWDNLVKILLYNMPVNLAQGLSVFFSYIVDVESVPLTAMQVLYVNMITSVTMGLMLSMEPAEADIMQRPPRKRGKRLFGKLVMWNCLWVSGLIVTCVLVCFAWNLRENPPTPENTARRSAEDTSPRMNKARAEAFNMLVFAEIAYALNCRYVKVTSIRPELFTGNKWCWVAIAVTSSLQFLLTYTPGINDFFNNAPIDGVSWARIAVGSIIVFLVVEAMKFIGPRFLLPIVRPLFSVCLSMTPPALQGPDRTNEEEMQNVHFVATSASTFGVPPARRASANRTSGHREPVSPSAVPLSPQGGHMEPGKNAAIPPMAPAFGGGKDLPAMQARGMAPQMPGMFPQAGAPPSVEMGSVVFAQQQANMYQPGMHGLYQQPGMQPNMFPGGMFPGQFPGQGGMYGAPMGYPHM